MSYYIQKLKTGHLQLFAIEPSGAAELRSECLAYRPVGGVWTLSLTNGPCTREKAGAVDVTEEEAAMILFQAKETA